MDIKKIVVIGPESTGKSTLSEMLAAALGTVWVPEYARQYLEERGPAYIETDLLAIAQGQLKSEEAAIQQAQQYLVCDTDLYVIKVWSEHKYNNCHTDVLNEIAHRPYDLYLLTDIDIAWETDSLREYPEQDMREYFFHVYHDIVQQSGVPWLLVSGSPEDRLQMALSRIALLS